MEKAHLGHNTSQTRLSGPCTVVSLTEYRRASHRLFRFFRRRTISFVWTAIGVMLLAVMVLGASYDSGILKAIAWLSVGIALFLIAPFSWWLNDTSHR